MGQFFPVLVLLSGTLVTSAGAAGQGREQVNSPDLLLYAETRRDTGSGHQERYPQSRIVEEDPVRIFTMFRETLSVVR